jgi:hypothetical protein
MLADHVKKSFVRDGYSREIRLVSDALINLYSAYVNSLLYPYDNPLISDTLRNAYQCLEKAAQKKSVITVDIVEGGVRVNGEPLEDLLVFRNFSSWLKTNHIESMSFVDGLSRRELISFHKIISLKKNSEEDLADTLLEKNVTNVTVRLAGFSQKGSSSPVFSDEGEEGLIMEYMGHRFDEAPVGPVNFDGPAPDGEVYSSIPEEQEKPQYERMVEMLLEHRIPEDELGVLRNMPPMQMAHLLNAMLFSTPAEDVIMRITEAYFGDVGEMSGEEASGRCAIFLQGLKPGLRPVFKKLAIFASLENFGSDEASPVMTESRSKVYPQPSTSLSTQEEILAPHSPYVRRMVNNSGFIFDFIAEGKAVLHDIEFPVERAHLFENDNPVRFKNRVAPDQFISEFAKSVGEHSKSVAVLMGECSDEMTRDVSFDIMIELLASDDIDAETFQRLAGKLTDLLGSILKKGALDKALDVFNTLKTRALQDDGGYKTAAIIRGIFSSDQFNAQVVESLRRFGRQHRETSGRLAGALRSYLIPYLLDALSDETDTSKRKFMIMLLTSIPGDVLSHITRRLSDSRWYVLRNMLLLLRECQGRSQASEVKDFLEHEVPLVRLEALRTLLSFQAHGAEEYVVKFLQSENPLLQKGAAWLAGTYRIKEAVPHLVRLLDEKDPLNKKVVFKRGIVRALGRIGDGSVVGHLLSVCHSINLRQKENYDKLRTDIFKTLQNYPLTSVKPLIDYGLQSSNKEIVALSSKLMGRYNLSVKRQEK